MLERELTNLLRENCLGKRVANKVRRKETMAACWKMLDTFYNRLNDRNPSLQEDMIHRI
jgi:hypothetical protein